LRAGGGEEGRRRERERKREKEKEEEEEEEERQTIQRYIRISATRAWPEVVH
jgi:hypothetical protein